MLLGEGNLFSLIVQSNSTRSFIIIIIPNVILHREGVGSELYIHVNSESLKPASQQDFQKGPIM